MMEATMSYSPIMMRPKDAKFGPKMSRRRSRNARGPME